MDTNAVTPTRLAQSVIAVPPLARSNDGALAIESNRRIIQYLEQGGINILLYGGNALFYHLPLSQYAATLQMLVDQAAKDTLVVPSVGPAYGTMMDQASILADFAFPTVMVLPQRDIADEQGIARGIRSFAEVFGKPVVVYLKFPRWLSANTVASLIDDGLISWIKYAVVLDDPSDDAELRTLVDTVGPERIISGIGEQPAIIHMRDFGVTGFTSGCVCVAPTLSMAMLRAVQAKDYETAEAIRHQFRPLEDLRNEINPIRVLHRAVELAEIAPTGPILPLLSELPQDALERVRLAAQNLKQLEISAATV